jgi:hypothetical protein
VQRLILEFGLDQYVSLQKGQLKREQSAALRRVVESRMIAPVRALYPTAARAEELVSARADIETLATYLGA